METISIYTDGSNFKDEVAAWAFIAFKDNQEIHRAGGILTGDICKTHNIGAELKAVVEAIRWCKRNDCKAVIYTDLQGAILWVNDLFDWKEQPWKTNNEWTRFYRKFCFENKKWIEKFEWIKGHADSANNNSVDKYVGRLLRDYKEGSNTIL